MLRGSPHVAVTAILLSALAACGDDSDPSGSGGSTSSSASGESTTSTRSTSSGHSTSTGTSTGGESGGAGGGEPTFCTPGDTRPCYTGPAGTEGVGLCASGTETCNDEGSAFGACAGEVVPALETCASTGDDDCDGDANEEGADCLCVPGTIADCYSADPSTLGVGICTGGTQECNPDGLSYSTCVGEVVPALETCNTPNDDDCDGDTNEEGDGCVCTPNDVVSCYTGPAGTEGVGVCTAGTATCNDQGTDIVGPCAGEVLPTQQDCDTPEDEACGASSVLCPGDHLWSKRFGDAEMQRTTSMVTDSSGNVLVTGYFSGTLDFGGGPLTSAGYWDAFVAKFDGTGSHVWSKRFGDAAEQVAYSVAVDLSGNVLVTGSFSGSVDFGSGPIASGGGDDMFVVKYDAAGNHVWSNGFGAASPQYGGSVATDVAGNVVVTGTLYGTVDFGGGPLTSAGGADILVAKFDAAGNHLWSKRFGALNTQAGRSVVTDSAGNVIVTGFVLNTVDFGGGPLADAGNNDIFLVKLDAAGDHLWSKRFGDSSGQVGLSVAVDMADNVLFAGMVGGMVDLGGGPLTSMSSGTNVVTAKYDPAGNHLFSKRFGFTSTDSDRSIATDAAGNVILTGERHGPVDFGGGSVSGAGGSDVFVAKFDATGNHLWDKRFGDSSSFQVGQSVGIDPTGNVFVSGDFHGTLDFDGSVLTSAGSYDIFLAKLAP